MKLRILILFKVSLLVLLAGVSQSTYTTTPPPYGSYGKEYCETKEWSSDTEMCLPSLDQSCNQDKQAKVHHVRRDYSCMTIKVPKCKVVNTAMEVENCSLKPVSKGSSVYAKTFDTQLTKRCDTHYQTVCQKNYGGRPHCYSQPIHNCYDIPVLVPENVDIEVKTNDLEQNCVRTSVPMPTTVCKDEEFEFCPRIPSLEEDHQNLLQCAPGAGEEVCQKIRLNLEREICYGGYPQQHYQG